MYRTYSLMLSLLVATAAMTGCATMRPNQPITPLQKQEEIAFFARTATRIALVEFDASDTDVDNLKSYIDAAKGLIAEAPDLDALRAIIESYLPDKYQMLGLTVMDVVERYIITHLPNPNEDTIARNKLINAGLDGALGGIEQYIALILEKPLPVGPDAPLGTPQQRTF
jgi:hypothetical protein